MLCWSPYQRMRWRWCNAFGDNACFVHVHLLFKLHNYQTPRLAEYADDGADAQSVDSTQILYGFATVYATDCFLVVNDGVGREFVAERSCMFSFNSVIRTHFIFLTQFCQTCEVWTQFHKLRFMKIKFLSSPLKRLRCIYIGAKADDIDLFDRTRHRQCDPHLAHDIYYTWFKWREQIRHRPCSDRFRNWAIITTFVGANQHHETEDGKSWLRAKQEKSRLHAHISFLLVSWDIDMCQRLYRKNYNIHVRFQAWLINCV